MNYQKTTQVPNEIFDAHLKELTFSELKALLYIIRQTYGWKLNNGNRKQRDRITHNLMKQKTGLSRRVISDVIQSLIIKDLILVTDYEGNKLHTPEQRKGKVGIYYAPHIVSCAKNNKEICKQKHQAVHNKVHNKTKITKLNKQIRIQQRGRISDWERMQQILQTRKEMIID